MPRSTQPHENAGPPLLPIRTEIRFLSPDGQEKRVFSDEPSHFGLPLSALTVIEWISLHYPADSRRILRARVETTLPESIPFRETIKAAAKRMTFLPALPEPGGERIEIHKSERPSPLPLSPPTLFDWEKTLYSNRTSQPLYEQDRAVVASIWIEGESQPRLIHANRNQKVRAWHAEVLLCLEIAENPEPYRGKRMFWAIGLKPCRMCAAWITTLMQALDCEFELVYARNDPGPFAQGTALDRLIDIQESFSSWAPKNPERARNVFGDVQLPSQKDE